MCAPPVRSGAGSWTSLGSTKLSPWSRARSGARSPNRSSNAPWTPWGGTPSTRCRSWPCAGPVPVGVRPGRPRCTTRTTGSSSPVPPTKAEFRSNSDRGPAHASRYALAHLTRPARSVPARRPGRARQGSRPTKGRGTAAPADNAVYVSGTRTVHPHHVEATYEVMRERAGTVWIGLHRPGPAEVHSVADGFGLRPLDEYCWTGPAGGVDDTGTGPVPTARWPSPGERTRPARCASSGACGSAPATARSVRRGRLSRGRRGRAGSWGCRG